MAPLPWAVARVDTWTLPVWKPGRPGVIVCNGNSYMGVSIVMGVPQNGQCTMESPIQMYDLGTPILGNLHIDISILISNVDPSKTVC